MRSRQEAGQDERPLLSVRSGLHSQALRSSGGPARKLHQDSREPLQHADALCACLALKQGPLRRSVSHVRAIDGGDGRGAGAGRA
jgi:hypothetical protein